MTERNRAVIHRFVEQVWNQGQLDAADEIVHRSYRLADPDIPPTRATGADAIRHEVKAYRAAFPDLHFTVDETIAEGDKVVIRWSARGTHKGPAPFSATGSGDWMYLPSTGLYIEATGVSIMELIDGQIASIRRFWRPMSMLRALAVPGSRTPTRAQTEARQ